MFNIGNWMFNMKYSCRAPITIAFILCFARTVMHMFQLLLLNNEFTRFISTWDFCIVWHGSNLMQLRLHMIICKVCLFDSVIQL
jgi:hypothetical protein